MDYKRKVSKYVYLKKIKKIIKHNIWFLLTKLDTIFHVFLITKFKKF